MKPSSVAIRHTTKFMIGMFVLMIGLFLGSCDGSSTPKGSLSGRVILVNDTGNQLLDPVDYSGITVALYRPAVIDSTLARLNQLHPGIGVIYNQKTAFDHRLQTPVATVTSDATGAFRFTKIPVGSYNLVFLSTDWSVRYLCDISITEDKSGSVGDVEILRNQSLSGVTTDNMIFKSNKQYLITDNLSCVGNVTVEPGTVITPNPGVSVKFYGAVSMSSSMDTGDYWRYTANYGMNSTEPTSMTTDKYAAGLMFYINPLVLKHGLISYSDFGISVECPSANLSDLSFNYVTYGAFLSRCSLTANNLSLLRASSYGLSTQNVDETVMINKSIVAYCSDGITTSGGTYTVSNTYFQDCYAAYRPFENTGTVQNCNFAKSYYDIYQYRSSCYVFYNNFYSCRRQSLQPRNFAQSNNNNYYQTDSYFIDVRGVSMAADLDAKNNYWGVSNIDQYLNDALDNDAFPDEPPCLRYVVYLPKRSVRVATAGIQP